MSVSKVFGTNLRLLTEMRGSVSAVSRELDINRVQYNRYLNGESFPKPMILKNICDLFGVDARIYTDPLTKEQIAGAKVFLGTGKPAMKLKSTRSEALKNMQAMPVNGLGCDVPQSVLPDGLHLLWRRSFTDETKAACLLLSVKTEGELRFCRGFERAGNFKNLSSVYGYNTREFGGIVTRAAGGFTLLVSKKSPSFFITTSYFASSFNHGDDLFYGLSFLHRAEFPHMRRVSRAVFQLMPQKTSEILRAARVSSVMAMENVPDRIANLITQDVA